MTKRLENKAAIVTGGARGMGAAHSRAIVREGGFVTIADIDDAAGAALVEELGDAAQFVRLDVTREDEWATAVQRTVDRFGRLDVLVNNAGILIPTPILDTTLEAWERVLRINLTGTFLGMRAVAPVLRASDGGSIVNIASVAGRKGIGGVGAYVASKHGIVGLTKTAALELASSGVRVNVVQPGFVATDMLGGTSEFPGVAQHRAGRPDEVAELVVFLASDQSSFITGGEYLIDGGEMAGAAID